MIDAPIEAYFFIVIKFKIKFATAPITTEIVNSVCLFVGNRYWVPVILLSPINNVIGTMTFINTITFSYPCPKRLAQIHPKLI